MLIALAACCIVSQALPDDRSSSPKSSSDPTRDFRAFKAALVQQLTTSPRPRDRALATRLDYAGVGWLAEPTDDATRDAMLGEAARSAPNDFMLQWAALPGNPQDCHGGPICRARFEAAARVQPDNAAAWIPVLGYNMASHDERAVDVTLEKMASATRYDEPDGMFVKAWLDVVARHPPPQSIKMTEDNCNMPDARLELVRDGLTNIESGTPGYSGLFRACQTEVTPQVRMQRAGTCAAIGRLMMRSGTLAARGYGLRLLSATGQATANDLPQARVVLWDFEHQNSGDPPRECSETQPTSLLISDWEVSDHEIEVQHRRMVRAGVPLQPPSGWQPRKNGHPVDPLGTDAW